MPVVNKGVAADFAIWRLCNKIINVTFSITYT